MAQPCGLSHFAVFYVQSYFRPLGLPPFDFLRVVEEPHLFNQSEVSFSLPVHR
jgi:hypothetical protein